MSLDVFWANLGEILTAAGVIYVAYQNTKLRGEVREVHQTTNSKMDLLLRTTKDAGHAEGKEEQRQETAHEHRRMRAPVHTDLPIELEARPRNGDPAIMAWIEQGMALQRALDAKTKPTG